VHLKQLSSYESCIVADSLNYYFCYLLKQLLKDSYCEATRGKLVDLTLLMLLFNVAFQMIKNLCWGRLKTL